jgi:hypothetical protein
MIVRCRSRREQLAFQLSKFGGQKAGGREMYPAGYPVTIDSMHMIYSEVVVVWRDWIPRDRCSQLHFRYNIDTEKDNIKR